MAKETKHLHPDNLGSQNISLSNDLKAVFIDKRIVYKDRSTWIPFMFIVICASVNAFHLIMGEITSVVVATV